MRSHRIVGLHLSATTSAGHRELFTESDQAEAYLEEGKKANVKSPSCGGVSPYSSWGSQHLCYPDSRPNGRGPIDSAILRQLESQTSPEHGFRSARDCRATDDERAVLIETKEGGAARSLSVETPGA